MGKRYRRRLLNCGFCSLVICLCTACTESNVSAKHEITRKGYLESLVKNPTLLKKGFIVTHDQIFVLTTTEVAGMSHRMKLQAKTLGMGNALLEYAQDTCPNVTQVSGIKLSGSRKIFSGYDGNSYNEIWALPKKQIDDHLAATCNR